MNDRDIKIVIVASTEGSVINAVLNYPVFRDVVHSVVVDRQCGAIDKGRTHGLDVHVFDSENVDSFCLKLLDHCMKNEIDYVFSYYTNFYSKQFRDAFRDRIVNFHPSILPAFKGMDGFGDSIAYHARFVGNTVEFIDQVMDEGKIIMQTVCPVNVNEPTGVIRHKIFVQQCKALLQVAKWLIDGRVKVDGRRVHIEKASFDDASFSPSLEFQEAIDFDPEFRGS